MGSNNQNIFSFLFKLPQVIEGMQLLGFSVVYIVDKNVFSFNVSFYSGNEKDALLLCVFC